MKNITNLNDLLIEQAREVYDAEKQQLEALRDIARKARSLKLKQMLEAHIDHTEIHKERLELVFDQQHELVTGEQNQTMKGLVNEMIELVNRSADPEILDAVLIASIQQIEHFEIAAYGTLCAFAWAVGKDEIANTLHVTLEEEKEFDRKLTKLAEDHINKKAVTALVT